MSDSLITFQPAIEEPSNMMPSVKASSSMILASMVTCCIFPRGSVKRRSTNLTSSSLIFLVTLLASAIVLPCDWHLRNTRLPWLAAENNPLRPAPRRFFFVPSLLDGVVTRFAGANAHGFFHIRHENLSIADAACLRGGDDRVDRLLDHVVAEHKLELHLGQKVDDVFRAAIELGVAFLAAETLGFG